MRSISKKIKNEFVIRNITTAEQKKLLKLNNLHNKQIKILQELTEKKDKLINSIILQYNNKNNV